MFANVFKFNENHDEKGRFASGEGGGEWGQQNPEDKRREVLTELAARTQEAVNATPTIPVTITPDQMSMGIEPGQWDLTAQKVLTEYSGRGYIGINHSAMGRPGHDNDQQIRLLDTIFDKVKATDQSFTVFRGLRGGYKNIPGVDAAEAAKDPSKLVGQEYTEKRYVSTSMNLDDGKDFATRFARHGTGAPPAPLLAIDVPVGSKVLAGNKDESELIIQRGQRFKIVDYRKQGGIPFFHVKMLPPKATKGESSTPDEEETSRFVAPSVIWLGKTKKEEGMFARIFKFNQNHAKDGKFTTVGDGVSSEDVGAVLGKMAQNEDAHPNIMNMVVDGKKPFGGDDNLGIARKDMPQVPEPLQQEFLKGLGVKVEDTKVDPMTLKPTQDQLDGFKVGRFMEKIIDSHSAAKKHTLVSSDGYILDGHHHWGARVALSLQSQKTSKLPIYRIHMPIRELLTKAHAFNAEHNIQGKDISKAEEYAFIFKFNENHDEKGRFASAEALGEDVGGPIPPKGEFLVYRLGRSGKLGNDNAGNAEGLATHLMNVDWKEDAPDHGDTIFAFKVQVKDGEWGPYARMNDGSDFYVDPERSKSVGRTSRGRTENGPGIIWYSFPKGGSFTYKLVGQVPLAKARENLKHLTTEGNNYFSSVGVSDGADAIRQAFKDTKVAKGEGFSTIFKFNQNHDEHGRFAAADSAGDNAKDVVYQANYGSPEVPVSMTREVAKEAEALHIKDMKGAAQLVDKFGREHHDELVKMIDALPPSKDPFILLHRGDKEQGIPSIWLLGWSNKEATDIHDHIDSQVGVKVLRGNIKETFYDYNPKEDIHAKEGFPVTSHERDLKEGQTSPLPAPYIHKVVGYAEDRKVRDISLHAYYPPLSKQNFFKIDEKTGRAHYDGYWDENDPKTERSLVEKGRARCFCCATLPITKFERALTSIFKEGTTPGAIKAWDTRRNGGAPDVEVTGKSPLVKGEFVSVKRNPDGTWARTDGVKLSPEDQARLKGLVIPPAYKSIKFNTDPMGRVQATGVNAVGKVQAKYHDLHVLEAAQAKWDRVNDFNKNGIRGIESQSAKDMLDRQKSQMMRDTAATVNLIAHTGFRPGSETDTHAQEQAYGASTLEKRHITVDGNKVSFEFTGKKGVPITKEINNKGIAQYLSSKLAGLGPTDKVFTTSDSLVRQYVKKVTGDDAFKTKDMRTWNGTGVAYKMTRSMPAPTNLSELKAARNKVGDAVAAHLGNTRTVALSSYVAPYVFHQWERGLGLAPGSASMKPAKRKKEEDGLDFNDLCRWMDQACAENLDRSPIDWRSLPDDEDEPYMVYKTLEPV